MSCLLWLRGLRLPHSPSACSTLRLLPSVPSFKPLLRPHIGPLHMSRDVSHLSDISRMTTETGGAFKRAPSSFRNFIQAGGEFPPERGTWCTAPLIFESERHR